ncbi:MAG TPA: hypothetical protein ENO30_04315, partial [Thermodesulfobium narugense]|nr:hypothetical protein [Thermodesulfobium narugense]
KIGPLSVIKRRRSFLLNERETVSAGSTMLDSVDEEVKKMLSKIYEDAKNTIQQYQEAVSKIADKLVDKETLSSQEVIEIVQTTKKKTKRGRKKQNK